MKIEESTYLLYFYSGPLRFFKSSISTYFIYMREKEKHFKYNFNFKFNFVLFIVLRERKNVKNFINILVHKLHMQQIYNLCTNNNSTILLENFSMSVFIYCEFDWPQYVGNAY